VSKNVNSGRETGQWKPGFRSAEVPMGAVQLGKAMNEYVLRESKLKPLFTPGHMLYPLVAVSMFLVSATELLPVCRPSDAGYKGIQVDSDINE